MRGPVRDLLHLWSMFAQTPHHLLIPGGVYYEGEATKCTVRVPQRTFQ